MSRGTIAEEMNSMVPGAAANTTLRIIHQCEDGITLGYTLLTAYGVLTAGADAGTWKFAPGCMIMSVSSAAALSVRIVTNTNIATAPTFTGLVTA
jgi:hypothetical protein